MSRKGFTLIELIIVMVIISILVLLGVPKYKEYTKEAHLTKIKVNVKEIESASSQYYMRYNDWPRLSNEPYTSEQIENFGKQILDKTGAVVSLEPDGNYYDIAFDKIANYVKLPDDNVNYILQNPVGKVFFIEGITKEAKIRIPDDNDGLETPNEPEVSENIIFKGVSPDAFDKDSTTGVTGNSTVTWEGNLDNKKVTVDMGAQQVGSTYNTITLQIYDVNNNLLNFINLTDSRESSALAIKSRTTKEIIVPEGAVRFSITNGSTSYPGRVYDIYVSDNLKSPKSVYDITSISTDSSITLNWKQDDSNYDKVAIYKDGKFLKIVSDKTFTDKPLYSDTSHTYSLKAINSYGNASTGLVSYTASTSTPEIIFRGLSPAAFDKDDTTGTSARGTVTWEGNLDNKKIIVHMLSHFSTSTYDTTALKIYDINNNQLNFMNLTSGKEVAAIAVRGRGIVEIIVPEGAVKFVITSSSSSYAGTVYDIYLSE